MHQFKISVDIISIHTPQHSLNNPLPNLLLNLLNYIILILQIEFVSEFIVLSLLYL